MQACWEGNLNQIKALTLQAWGNDNSQAPLKMDIRDNTGNAPFSIAFLKGHHDVARAILEIVKVQWSPAEKDQVRYKMEQDHDEEEYDDSCDGQNESDEDEAVLRIVPEVVGKPFTIDDIGKVSMHVKSHGTPVDVLNQSYRTFTIVGGKQVSNKSHRSMFQHCFDQEDTSGLKTLLELGQHFSGSCLSGDDTEESAAFSLTEADFSWAVNHGKTRMLALAIKRTGAGIPLDHLVKQSGVEEKQKPRFYQGLTVYGKKRYDLRKPVIPSWHKLMNCCTERTGPTQDEMW